MADKIDLTQLRLTLENDEEGHGGLPEREQWLIRDEDTNNFDVVAIVPKTGDEEYDDRVTYPIGKLLTAAPLMLALLQQVVAAADSETVEDGEGTVFFPYADVVEVLRRATVRSEGESDV